MKKKIIGLGLVIIVILLLGVIVGVVIEIKAPPNTSYPPYLGIPRSRHMYNPAFQDCARCHKYAKRNYHD